MGPAEEAPQEKKKRKSRPPLLAITLVRKVMDVSSISVEELSHRIHAGVLINDNKLKFWVDLDCGKNCFLLLAKSIHGIDVKSEIWRWIFEEEKCYEGKVSVEVAGMKSRGTPELSASWRKLWASWPGLSATFETIMLSPKTEYRVAFVVKSRTYRETSHGLLNLSLTLPDGTRLGRTEDLKLLPQGIWMDILVGTFVTTPKNVGKLTTNCTFSEDGTSELIVKGIFLRTTRLSIESRCYLVN